MIAKKVLIVLPNEDFDPTEAAVSWQILKQAGHQVLFATPDGRRAWADPLMLSGEGLDFWARIPGLNKFKLLGLLLRADGAARRAHAAMMRDSAFAQPLPYAALKVEQFDGLLLPGGHWARGMRTYLESRILQDFAAGFFDAGKPVGAICHGVVLAARSISAVSGKSVLYGRKTTALPWKLERAAWTLMKIAGRTWDPDYYRTYTELPGDAAGYRSVQAEVTRALARPQDFLDAPAGLHNTLQNSGLARDSANDKRAAWVVRDGNYVSARWPGDVHAFAQTFATMLAESPAALRAGSSISASAADRCPVALNWNRFKPAS